MGYYSEVAVYITADNIQALIDEFNAAVPEAGTDFADFVDNYSKYLQVSADEFLFYADYVKWYTWGSHNGFPIVSGPNGAQWLESFVDWVREAHPESSGAFVRIGTYKRDVSAHSWGPEGAGTIQLVQEIKFNEDLTSRFLSGADDWDFIVNQATSVLYDVYGIDAGILADQIIVTNTRGEELDET